ncbi:MAG: type I 3-dehydroquinate dehydratase [Nitrososphaerota archaeon]|jgi:3-dehydroquinate dehydratase type I|nr:type I 3-dehydroquinate dehydratase [Nitrososphaerota archaeon]
MNPRICASIRPQTISEAQDLIKKAEQSQADLIEIRLDHLEQTKNLTALTKNTTLPLIATNKLDTLTTKNPNIEIEKQQTLLNAAKAGFQYVDIDFFDPTRDKTITKLKQLGTNPIVSYHKFDGILGVSALGEILDKQIAVGAAVCKIVLTAKHIEDNLSVLSFIAFASVRTKLVCFCMGEAGKTSRLLAPAFGAYFTFAALQQGNETAPGQMTIADMRLAYKLLGLMP